MSEIWSIAISGKSRVGGFIWQQTAYYGRNVIVFGIEIG
jgi:hypothetical protein